jgi:hypothetical protein
VVHGEDGHRRVESSVCEREMFGPAADACATRVLCKHDAGGVNCHDRTIGRLVRSGSCAHVEHRVHLSQGLTDPLAQP